MSTDDHPPSSDGLVVFHAHDVGYSEVYWFLRSLRAHGVLDRLLLVCPAHFFEVHPDVVPFHIDDDGSDPERLERSVSDWVARSGRPVSGVIGVDEDRHFALSRRLAGRFGVPFHTEETCLRASNKYLLKVHLERQGVRTAPFALVRDADDSAIDAVGFPSVLKAVTSYGSQYLARCGTRAELVSNLDLIRDAARRAIGDHRFDPQRLAIDGVEVTLDPRADFLLEGWVGGEEYSCDFAVRHGAALVIRVARKIPGSHFGYFDGTRVLSVRDAERAVGLDRLTAACEGIRRALGADDGVCMVDFKIVKGELVVLEASVRPGLSATNHLVHELYGWTPLALLAMQRMGIHPDVTLPDENGAVVYLRAGVDRLDPARIARLRARHGADRVYLYHQAEATGPVPDADPSSLLRGYVVLTGLDGESWSTVVRRAVGTRRRTMSLPHA